MPDLDEIAASPLFSNSLMRWLVACAIALAVYGLLSIGRRIVRHYHARMKATERAELLEIPLGMLSKTTVLFFVALALYFGSRALEMGPKLSRVLDSAITIALFWQTGVWAMHAASAWIERKRRRSMAIDRAMAGSLGIIGFMLNMVIWTLVVMLTLDNLGVNITALIAGLGIGGIAIALAVQNILSDLFASLSITLDRPFVVGDALSVGEFNGTVEYIGIKSTRLRSVSGEQIVISNADLLAARVRNFGRMKERRVVFTTSIAHETPVELLERMPALIRSIVESQGGVRFDRCHFAKHGPVSLDFETVYFVLSADFGRYMDVQQAINLRLHRELAALGVRFAYPTQRLIVEPVQSRAGVQPQGPAESNPGRVESGQS